MSYGQNQPWGLQAIKTTNGSTWNGQTSSYLIQSGYAFNIFKGDLVFIGNDGYIHNLGELGNTTLQTRQSLGVFNGCSFQTSVATNPIDPASPGRSYWPAGTVTFNNIDATCDIIDDPSVIFNIQSDSLGVPFNAQGATAAVTYSFVTGTNPSGNTNTGASNVVLNTGTIGNNNFNLKILRFVPVSGNLPVGNGTNRVPYNNVEVIIQNHTFATRPTPY
jgi:hypothetical protein